MSDMFARLHDAIRMRRLNSEILDWPAWLDCYTAFELAWFRRPLGSQW